VKQSWIRQVPRIVESRTHRRFHDQFISFGRENVVNIRGIHSRLSNRLKNEKVDKLVFIYTNCVSFVKLDDNIASEGALVDGNE
jgi:hypothetical protein